MLPDEDVAASLLDITTLAPARGVPSALISAAYVLSLSKEPVEPVPNTSFASSTDPSRKLTVFPSVISMSVVIEVMSTSVIDSEPVPSPLKPTSLLFKTSWSKAWLASL